jgi:hypothetical protein
MSDRPPQSSWVSARVVVAESSIEGRGLFATTDLDIGDVVVHFGGNVVPTTNSIICSLRPSQLTATSTPVE